MDNDNPHPLEAAEHEHSIHAVVADIYRNPLTEQEKTQISVVRKELLDNDPHGTRLNSELRTSLQEITTLDGWKKYKEEAKKELAELDPTYLVVLLKRFAPFIKNLPAGHSKAHFLRDFNHALALMQDPELKADSVELMVGLTGGLFHDIGNGIVERFDDAYRVGAHAEVGAAFFGQMAKDIMPPHLLKMTQYAIAAHTHYNPGEVKDEKGNVVGARVPWQDDTDDEGNRMAVWYTRQTDRLDQTGAIFDGRNRVIRAVNNELLDLNPNSLTFDSSSQFDQQFGLTKEALKNGIISHCVGFAINVFADKPYTAHDTEHFRALQLSGIQDYAIFLSVVAPEKRDKMIAEISEQNPQAAEAIKQFVIENIGYIQSIRERKLTPQQESAYLEEFLTFCQKIEPAEKEDLEPRLNIIRNNFAGPDRKELTPEEEAALTPEQKQQRKNQLARWEKELLAKGFHVLATSSFTRQLRKDKENIAKNPFVQEGKLEGMDQKEKMLLGQTGNYLQQVAQAVHNEMAN